MSTNLLTTDLAAGIIWEGSQSIDSTFDALMEYAPKSLS